MQDISLKFVEIKFKKVIIILLLTSVLFFSFLYAGLLPVYSLIISCLTSGIAFISSRFLSKIERFNRLFGGYKKDHKMDDDNARQSIFLPLYKIFYRCFLAEYQLNTKIQELTLAYTKFADNESTLQTDLMTIRELIGDSEEELNRNNVLLREKIHLLQRFAVATVRTEEKDDDVQLSQSLREYKELMRIYLDLLKDLECMQLPILPENNVLTMSKVEELIQAITHIELRRDEIIKCIAQVVNDLIVNSSIQVTQTCKQIQKDFRKKY